MHYDRYMEGMDNLVNLMSKWIFGNGEKLLEGVIGTKLLENEKTPANMFLLLLEAMRSGALKLFETEEEGETMMRAAMYALVDKMVDNGKTTMAEILTSNDIGVLQRYFHDNVSERASLSVNHGFRYAYHVKTFAKEGERVYRVSPGLSDQLSCTLLKGLRCEDLRLPYPAVYVESPKVPQFRIWHWVTGWHEFEGAYLSEDAVFFDCGDRDEKANPITDKDELNSMVSKGRVINVMLTAPGKEGASLMDDAIFSFSVLMPEGVPLDEQVDHAALRFGLDKGEANSKTDWRGIFRWLINVMIYATWTNCEREHLWVDPKAQKLWNKLKGTKGKKAGKIQRQLNSLNSPRFFYLGRSIKIDRSAESGNGNSGSGGQLLVRQRISGHWKKQAHGAGWELRKLIWINPYWKGPEDGPIKQAVHELRPSCHPRQD